MSILFSPHPRQHLLLLVVLMMAILTGEVECGFDLHFLYG
jgi:hypothetical protein